MSRWLGVDVGAQRKGFDVALIDDRRLIELGSSFDVAGVLELVAAHQPRLTAIDSPRRPAPDGRRARPDELALSRAVCGIRWTPDRAHLAGNPYYGWIEAGLALFEALEQRGLAAIEVFPTAAWTRWIGPRPRTRSRAQWSRDGLTALARAELAGVPARTSQDARDAIAAAVTGRLHSAGQTDGYGEIVVPRAALPRPVSR